MTKLNKERFQAYRKEITDIVNRMRTELQEEDKVITEQVKQKDLIYERAGKILQERPTKDEFFSSHLLFQTDQAIEAIELAFNGLETQTLRDMERAFEAFHVDRRNKKHAKQKENYFYDLASYKRELLQKMRVSIDETSGEWNWYDY